MFNKKYLTLILFSIGINIFTTSASAKVIPIQQNTINMTAQQLSVIMSSKINSERINGNFYIAGVADASEGVKWCGYDRVSAVQLWNRINRHLKTLDSEQRQDRAATIINELLERAYPCKKQ